MAGAASGRARARGGPGPGLGWSRGLIRGIPDGAARARARTLVSYPVRLQEVRDERPRDRAALAGAGATAPAGAGSAAPAGARSAPPAPRRLLRARDDRIIGGVAGGLGKYFNVDPVFFRVGLVVLSFLGGLGVFLYLAALLFVPSEQADGGEPPRRSRGVDDRRRRPAGRPRRVAPLQGRLVVRRLLRTARIRSSSAGWPGGSSGDGRGPGTGARSGEREFPHDARANRDRAAHPARVGRALRRVRLDARPPGVESQWRSW